VKVSGHRAFGHCAMHITLAVILWTIVIGLVIGALGRLVVPGRQSIGMVWTIVIGIVAAFIGFLIASALGVAHTTGFNWIEHIIQVVLAAVGVAIVAGTGRRRA
jgi:uncharacterized membrane protein YeaQ/YmgE (transglycosylase-associated protein family)